MKATWNRDKEDLEFNGKHFRVWCHVRNEIDPVYIRRLHEKKEVVFAIVSGIQTDKPYMPRKFPKGTFEIYAVEEVSKDPTQKDFWPIKIKTNADHDVEIWALDKNCGYDHGTGIFVKDGCLWIHWCSWSGTTLGCGRAETEKQIRELGEMIQDALSAGKVFLEVI